MLNNDVAGRIGPPKMSTRTHQPHQIKLQTAVPRPLAGLARQLFESSSHARAQLPSRCGAKLPRWRRRASHAGIDETREAEVLCSEATTALGSAWNARLRNLRHTSATAYTRRANLHHCERLLMSKFVAGFLPRLGDACG